MEGASNAAREGGLRQEDLRGVQDQSSVSGPYIWRSSIDGMREVGRRVADLVSFPLFPDRHSRPFSQSFYPDEEALVAPFRCIPLGRFLGRPQLSFPDASKNPSLASPRPFKSLSLSPTSAILPSPRSQMIDVRRGRVSGCNRRTQGRKRRVAGRGRGERRTGSP